MVRRLLLVLLILVVAVIGLWIWALNLPEAPQGSAGLASRDSAGPAPRGSSEPGDANLIVPVAGIARSALSDSWGDPRDNGLRVHHGTDIVAPSMTAVVAAAPGVVEKLFESRAGGTTIYVRSPRRDWTYYYAHLGGYAPGLHEGQVVRAGDTIGYVGDTGDAGPGNYHLHFGLTRTTRDQHWYQGTDVDPYPYLAGKRPLR